MEYYIFVFILQKHDRARVLSIPLFAARDCSCEWPSTMTSFQSSPVIGAASYDVSRPSNLVGSPCKRQKFFPVECEENEGPDMKATSEEFSMVECEEDGGPDTKATSEEFFLVECEEDEGPDTKATSEEYPTMPWKHCKRVRRFLDMVSASKGFDVPSDSEVYSSESESDIDDDEDEYFCPDIKKFKGSTDVGTKMWKRAEFAVSEHNRKAGSDLQLLRIVKVNSQVVSGCLYYFTLEAGDLKIFHAKVYTSLHEDVMELESFEAA